MTGRVLLTGASGFIGRAAIGPLCEAGFEVHAVARRHVDAPAEVRWHRVDLLDREQMRVLVNVVEPSHLLHFAWYAEPGKYWTARENLDWLGASLVLLQAFSRSGGRRVVMAGTCAEYEWKDGLCDESSTPLVPSTLYGMCKHALNEVLGVYSQQYGLSSAWGRIFFPYGPHEQSSRLVPSVICALLQGQPALCSSGEQVRDFIHVGDVANAFVALLGSNIDGAVNIGSGQGVAVKEIAERIGARLGRPDLLHFGARAATEAEPPFVVADVRRLEQEMKWRPATNLDAGLATTIDWWRGELSRRSDLHPLKHRSERK
jgi:nucleoside-diphosphate-sugar epimerase